MYPDLKDNLNAQTLATHADCRRCVGGWMGGEANRD